MWLIISGMTSGLVLLNVRSLATFRSHDGVQGFGGRPPRFFVDMMEPGLLTMTKAFKIVNGTDIVPSGMD